MSNHLLRMALLVSPLSLAGCGIFGGSNDAIVATTADTVEIAENVTPVESEIYDYGPAKGSIEDFVLNAGERVYFDANRYNLDDADKAALQRQAQWLTAYPDVTILLSGHCDERGTRDYNLALGAKRAAAVRDYLISLGIEAIRIKTISYGKDRPLDDAHNEAAWSRNRNVWTQITGGAN